MPCNKAENLAGEYVHFLVSNSDKPQLSGMYVCVTVSANIKSKTSVNSLIINYPCSYLAIINKYKDNIIIKIHLYGYTCIHKSSESPL